MSDFRLYSDSPHPTVFLLYPRTHEARVWVQENIAPWDNAPRYARPVPVEHRYIDQILEGIVADGLTVSR